MKIKESEFYCRPPVRWFACEMERKLRENNHKEGWVGEDTGYLLKRLREETEELKAALGEKNEREWQEPVSKRIISEAADVANFAMMIAEQYTAGIGGE